MMVHNKFQGHQPFGSGDFLRFLQYMGMVAILVKWPGPFEQNLPIVHVFLTLECNIVFAHNKRKKYI